MTLYARFAAHLNAVLDALEAEGALPPGLNRAAITVEPPRDPSHGDLSTNAAMVLAKPAGSNPRALAEAIVPRLVALAEVDSAAAAAPASSTSGARAVWEEELGAIVAAGADTAVEPWRRRTGEVEFVRPPTADAYAIAGRVVGDVLASLLEYAGFRVPANIMSTMRVRRSIRSVARRTCAIARRWARRSARFPTASIRAIT